MNIIETLNYETLTRVVNNPNAIMIAQLATKGLAMIGLVPQMKQSETISIQNTITTHTIEDGSDISDHIIVGAEKIEQKFCASILSKSTLEGIAKLAPITTLLMMIAKSKQVVSVLTNYSVFKNMVIEELSFEDKVDAYNTVICTIKFAEIKQASPTVGFVSSMTTKERIINTADKMFGIASQTTTWGNVIPTSG